MLKKIILTLLVILAAWLFVRWRQKKAAEVARAEPVVVKSKQNNTIYYLAGSVVTLMLVSIVLWFYL